MKPFSELPVASDRRVLICIPIVHTQADMGALNEPIQRLKVKKLGKKIWEHNLELVKNFWTQIEQATEEPRTALRKSSPLSGWIAGLRARIGDCHRPGQGGKPELSTAA